MTQKRQPTREEIVEKTVEEIIEIFLEDSTVKPLKSAGIQITEATQVAIQEKMLAVIERIYKQENRFSRTGD